MDPNICFHETVAHDCDHPEDAGPAQPHITQGALILLFAGLVPPVAGATEAVNLEMQQSFDNAATTVKERIEAMGGGFQNVRVELQLHSSQIAIGDKLLQEIPNYPAFYTDIVVHILCHAEPNGGHYMAHNLQTNPPPYEGEVVAPQLVSGLLRTFAQQNPARRLRLLCLSMCVGAPVAEEAINALHMEPHEAAVNGLQLDPMNSFCVVGTGQENTEAWDSGAWFVRFYRCLFSRINPANVLTAFNYMLDLHPAGLGQPFMAHRVNFDPATVTITPPPRMVDKYFRVGSLPGHVRVPVSITGAELKVEIRGALGAVFAEVELADITLFAAHNGVVVADAEPVPEDIGAGNAVAIRVEAAGVTGAYNTVPVAYWFRNQQWAVGEFPHHGTFRQLRDSIRHDIVERRRGYCWMDAGFLSMRYPTPNDDAEPFAEPNIVTPVPHAFYDLDNAPPIVHVGIQYPTSPREEPGPGGADPVPLNIDCYLNDKHFVLDEFPSNATVEDLSWDIWRHPDVQEDIGELPETDLVLKYQREGDPTPNTLTLLGQALFDACPGCVDQGVVLIMASLKSQAWGRVLLRLSGNAIRGLTRLCSTAYGWVVDHVIPTGSLLIHIACSPDPKTLEALESMDGVEILGYNEGTLVLDRDLSSLCWKVTMSEMDEGVICNLFACLPAEPSTVLQHISNECEMWFRGPLAGYIAHKQRASHGLLRGVTDVKIDAIDVVGISDLTDSERLLVGERILTALVRNDLAEIVALVTEESVRLWRDIDGSSVLHWVAAMGKDEVYRWIVENRFIASSPTISLLTPASVSEMMGVLEVTPSPAYVSSVVLQGQAPDIAVRYGLIATDIDDMLLDKSPGAPERMVPVNAQAVHLLMKLLVAGFRITAITYNSTQQLLTRLVNPIVTELRSMTEMRRIRQFTAYCEGASRRLTFDDEGTPIEDEGYARMHYIQREDAEIIRQVLEEERATFIRKATTEDDTTHTMLSMDYNCAPIYENLSRECLETNVSVQCRPMPADRDAENLDQVCMFVLRRLPGKSLQRETGDEVGPSIRRQIADRIESQLHQRLNPARIGLYRISCGGHTSIDITLRHTNKATAIKYELQNYGSYEPLSPEHCLYFGNELVEGGNDFPVAQIRGLTVVAVNQRVEDIDPLMTNVFYGGHRGCHSYCHQLSKLLECFEYRKREQSRVIPTIRYFIIKMLENTIAGRLGSTNRSDPRYYGYLVQANEHLALLFGGALPL